MIVILSALKIITKEASVTDVVEIVQRDEQKRGLQSPHASIAEFMGVLDVNEGTSLISSQAFEITTEKKGLQYPHASIAVFVGVLDDGISLFSTQALEKTTA